MRRLLIVSMLLAWAVPGLASAAPGGAGAAKATGPAPAVRAAVLYFDYDGQDDELIHLRKGLAAMLISDLSGVDSVQLVERADLQKVIDELELGKKRTFDQKTTAKVGKLLGAKVLVTGRYFTFGGKLLVAAKVIDVETGRVEGVRAARPVAQFLELESELADQLAGRLRTRAAKASATPGPAPAPPTRHRSSSRRRHLAMHSAAQYGRALDALDHGDEKQARKLLGSVVAEEPSFALAQSELRALVR